ncbi:MAG: CoA transferase [Syntrophorhabdales bacterium]|jgi:crotonobetainyl-CoA:carnitine CoA-transferase CaiB-like acyl-CoA transferase
MSRCRALDLTDEIGFLSGKILADLGVDVIKVEKPGGDAGRRIGPFWKDIPDPEKSLYWFAYNGNKRGITLNIETGDGRQILGELVKKADFVLESFPPGYMSRKKLGWRSLRKINERTILVSITPFGQKGPYKNFAASDMIAMAMSGMLYLTGDADRPPLNISLPQSYLLAGADGAVGAMLAYYHRERTGKGQHVDVSLQQSSGWFLANAVPTWELAGTNLRRAGALRMMSASETAQRQVWPCRDGHVFFFMLGGETGAKQFRKVVQWMDDEGMGDPFLRGVEWERLEWGTVTQEMLDRISKPIADFLATKTRYEVEDAATKRTMSMYCLSSMEDLVKDRHLKARNFWVDVDHSELGAALPYPRQMARMSALPPPEIFRAPLIGEHNREVFGEIGLSDRDLVTLKGAGVI